MNLLRDINQIEVQISIRILLNLVNYFRFCASLSAARRIGNGWGDRRGKDSSLGCLAGGGGQWMTVGDSG